MLFAAEVHIPVADQFLLCLAHEGVEAGFNIGQTIANMAHQRGI